MNIVNNLIFDLATMSPFDKFTIYSSNDTHIIIYARPTVYYVVRGGKNLGEFSINEIESLFNQDSILLYTIDNTLPECTQDFGTQDLDTYEEPSDYNDVCV